MKSNQGAENVKKEASRQWLKNRPALMSQCEKKKLPLNYPSLTPQLMSHARNLTAIKTIKQ